MQTVTIGNVQITPVLDAAVLMNPRTFIPGHEEDVAREFAHQADERGLLPMAITTYLVRSAGKTLLVDSGLGARKRPGFPNGHLDDALAAAGVRPEEIDVVLNTHLHIDHVGWNTVPGEDGKPRIFFPNATFVFQQREWDYWMTPENLADPRHPHLAECVQPVADAGRVTLHPDTETAFDANITFVASPGHTPGHVAVGIASAGERALIVGDASHHPVHVAHPDWSPGIDLDPILSAKSREALLDRAIAEESIWAAGHWPFPGMGRILRVEGKRVFRAL
ncbi:MAG: MBL fold metallo-hydrolase [Dehalococcoidia bacterium]